MVTPRQVAGIIGSVKDADIRKSLTQDFSKMFKESNERFNERTFIAAVRKRFMGTRKIENI